MRGLSPREAMIARLRHAAERDARVVGLMDYGSGSRGEADEWSDLDVEVFVRDQDLGQFSAGWKAWAMGLGPLLLAYRGHIGHPWTVFDTEPVPLRVDFDLHPESELDAIRSWPMHGITAESTVIYDGTGGRLTGLVTQLSGATDRPRDLRAAFEPACGDFWYYTLYVHAKLMRGQAWAAREVYHVEVMGQLIRLLRLEAGGIDRWHAAPHAYDIERTLPTHQLRRLEACIPLLGADDLWRALTEAALLGQQVCAAITVRHGWRWPSRLGERVVALLTERGTPTPRG